MDGVLVANKLEDGLVMRSIIFAVTIFGVLAGCTTIPDGPSVVVMPAPGKPFDLFVAEDRECRQFAQQSIGTSASQASTSSAEKSIAVGTALGAVAGALGGGQEGAGPGAAMGLMGGALVGSDSSRYSGSETQRRYDIAYEQCMYAKGNQIPHAAAYQSGTIYSPPPAQPYNPPPPPPED